MLLIARLDRLARNVAFISTLMENGSDFIACDMPTANRLTIHILAAVAEHEREMISKRTKAALAEARRRSPRPSGAAPGSAILGLSKRGYLPRQPLAAGVRRSR